MKRLLVAMLLAAAALCAQAQDVAVTPQGQPQVDKPPRDPDFGVGTRHVGLQRQVEMYQWVRSGDGYVREWRGARVDSSGFAPGHDNPRTMPLRARQWRAAVTLDGKPLPAAIIDRLGQWREFRPNFSALPGNMSATFQPEGAGLGSADNPLSPQVGDLRITWRELALPPLDGRLELQHGAWTLAPDAADIAAAATNPAGATAGTLPRGETAMPKITLLFAALHALMLVALAVPISLRRRRQRIGIGDGSDAQLALSIRVQGNFIEYVPLALLLLLLLELGGLPAGWLYAFGCALLLGRILHATGLSRSPGISFGRFWGTALTWLDLLAMSLAGLWLVLG